ncbi:MAG TPA: DNA primase [Candidatus Ruania gallistercoris]|uniref:DNA primase n=1 Tax=Candidatus Ruania gallistercoris TaxID=2838746 RepID=A0A9D2EDR5_9MICO|nr:DNA primase [Candidatus Ruania gallistercoris]
MAGLIRREDITAVRERAKIEEIVGQHVTLRSAGVGSMKGLCPFHDERSPSFHVRPHLGLWHCFGCGEGGDVISFVQKIDHLTFAEAVETLAAKAGVQLRYEDDGGPRRSPQEAGRRQRLLDAHRVAAEYYVAQLSSPEAQAGRDFLTSRGFDRTAAEQFGIGYAPKGWDNLGRHLRSKNFTSEELTASGLLSQGQRGSYDRFRGRLVWPIRDLAGAVVGFGARKLYEDDPGPKYLNTPETQIYKKSQVLYGIDLAKREIAKGRRVVVVEGYTDVMAMHLAGIGTAVATCGTAFGTDHIKIVRRLLGDTASSAAGVMLSTGSAVGGEVIFTFDGDEAGQKAALRAFEQDQQFASQTFVAVEPSGMDPCDLRQASGDEAVRSLVAEREPLFRFAIRSVLAQVDLNTAEGRVSGLRVAAPVVARIRDHALRGEYARELAGWLGMEESSVRQAVSRAARAPRAAGDGGGHQGGRPAPGPGPAEDGAPRGEEHNGRARPAAVRYADDPVARLERQVLEVVLQLPQHALEAGFDDLGADTFVVPAHRAVHDVIRAAGGVQGFGQIAEQLAASGAGTGATERAAATWAEQVRALAEGPVGVLITELAVAPLPQDRAEELGGYARGVLIALLRMGMTRQVAEVKGRLQRMDPNDPAYAEAFGELVRLEERRRLLNDSA